VPDLLERDERIHVAGTGEARQQERSAGQVDHVIDVEAVARSLLVARASKRSVEAVSEPVDRKTNVDYQKRGRPPPGERVATASRQHRDEAKERQVVGLHPRRQVAREPVQTYALERRKQARLLPQRAFEFGIERRLRRKSTGSHCIHACLARFLTAA